MQDFKVKTGKTMSFSTPPDTNFVGSPFFELGSIMPLIAITV